MLRKLIITGVLSTLLAVLLSFYVMKTIISKSYYINTTKLFEDFEMTKDMKKQLQTVGISRKNYLDSMHIVIESLDRQIRSGNKSLENEYTDKATSYLELKKLYESDQSEVANQFDKQVLDKLNQLIQEYGQENKIDYIFGVSGNGNIMYAKDADDITAVMLKYINSKYKKNDRL